MKDTGGHPGAQCRRSSRLSMRLTCLGTAGIVGVLAACTGPPPEHPAATPETPSVQSAATTPTSLARAEVTVNFPGASGLEATVTNRPQTPDMQVALPPQASLDQVVDLDMKTGAFPASGAQVTFALNQPVPGDKVAFVANWCPGSQSWVPLASETSPDGKSISAKLAHFSTYGLAFWSNLTGKLLSVRTSRPDCPAPPPNWDDNSAPQFFDDINGPVLWCATTDPAHPDDLEIKLKLNRGAAAAITTAIKPNWSHSDLWQGNTPETWSTMVLSGPDALVPDPGAYFIQPTGEYEFGFGKADVLNFWHSNRTKPLIQVDATVPYVLAGLIYTQISDASVVPALSLITTTMAIAQCSSEIYGAGVDLTLSSSSLKSLGAQLPGLMGALASCMSGQSDSVAQAAANYWATRNPASTITEVEKSAHLAAKRILVAARIYAAAQALAPVADAATDLLLDPIARQFIFQPSDQALKDYVQNNRPTVPGLPVVLEGKWCSQLNPSNCFSVADEKAKHPDLFVYYSGPAKDAPGATDYAFCIGHTPGAGNTCSTAGSIFVRYFPVGVGWDCSKNHAYYDQIPICDPDYSAAHDLSRPRIIHPPNHQQGSVYHDSEPMYLVSGGGGSN